MPVESVDGTPFVTPLDPLLELVGHPGRRAGKPRAKLERDRQRLQEGLWVLTRERWRRSG